MKSISETQAQRELLQQLTDIAASHEPIQIVSATTNAVLLAEDDWRSIEETLYLLSVPGMRESIRAGLQTPIDQCTTELVCLT